MIPVICPFRRRPRARSTSSLSADLFYVAIALLLMAPFAQDPMALAIGATVPWIILSLLARPACRWRWLTSLSTSGFRFLPACCSRSSTARPWVAGFRPNVGRAYWYMLASLVVLALALRLTLASVKPPTASDRAAHLEWRPLDLFSMYVAMLFVAVGCRFAGYMVPALDQPLAAVAMLKVVLLSCCSAPS